MTRLGYLLTCVTIGFGALLIGCGSSTTSVTLESLVPLDSEVTGWKIDPTNSKTSKFKTRETPGAIATNKKDAVDLVDGSAEDYWGEESATKVPKKFGWQVYLNDQLASSQERPDDGSVLQLYVMEMPSATAASGLYEWLVKDKQYPLWDVNWEEPSSPLVGTKSRVGNSNTDWWINFYKGIWYCEIRITPSYGPAPDYTENDEKQKTALFKFAKYVALNM